MKAGLTGIALIFAIAACSVASALGLTGLLKPIWLSLICRKLNEPFGSSAAAALLRPSERGTPPPNTHSIPVPAHIMHSSAPLRRLQNQALIPSPPAWLGPCGRSCCGGIVGPRVPGIAPFHFGFNRRPRSLP